METKTLVKFLKDAEGDIFAFFPSLNYNKAMYGNSMKTGYAHIGQHLSCHVDYAAECAEAKEAEYLPLLDELKQIGYNPLVLNKDAREKRKTV